MNKAAIALLVVGLIQICGEVLMLAGLADVGVAIKGIGAATTASPAPKVFTAHRGLETFSTQFTIEWEGHDGTRNSFLMTPDRYQRLRGPYNRRNVYGAVLAYGPVLKTNETTRPMFDAVSRFALTGNAPVLSEFGIESSEVTGPIRVRYEPREGTKVDDWPRVIEVERE